MNQDQERKGNWVLHKTGRPERPAFDEAAGQAMARQRSAKAYRDYKRSLLTKDSSVRESLEKLKIDLISLKSAVDGDFLKEVWGNWPRYVELFNQYRERAHDLAILDSELKVTPITPGGLSFLKGVGAGSPAEKAKITEISNNTEYLLKIIYTYESPSFSGRDADDSLDAIMKICARFHRVAKSLEKRHKGRNTLRIEDEYDVQDLMRSLLTLHYDDIRVEEWCPSFAGKSGRADLLLKQQKVFIEIKKTRENLSDKELSDQILLDIPLYKQHPDCKTLLVFIYDPEFKVVNAKGIEDDIARHAEKALNVKIIIAPKR